MIDVMARRLSQRCTHRPQHRGVACNGRAIAPIRLTVLLLFALLHVVATDRDWSKKELVGDEHAPEDGDAVRLLVSVHSSGMASRSAGQHPRPRRMLSASLASPATTLGAAEEKPDVVRIPPLARRGSVAEDVAASLLAKTSYSVDSSSAMIPGLSIVGDAMKVLAVCALCAIGIRMVTVFCSSKRGDVRRCRLCGSLFLCLGFDEFEAFDMTVTVHRLDEMKKEGLLGSSEYRVKISANWSSIETSPTKDCSWDQTKSLEVPQGASEIEVSLFSVGKWKDSKVASCFLETTKNVLDEEGFFGKQQKLRLESKGKPIGVLLITFRQKGDGAGGGGGGSGGGGSVVPIAGVNGESALGFALQKEWDEMCQQSDFKKPEGKLQGEQKMFLLSKVLSDDLRDVSDGGKEMGKIFVRVICCNFADLQGDHREEEMAKQKEKAKKKGLAGLPRKWYFCWYEDRKKATQVWTHPDGFIPLATITGVHKEPKRNDEFVIKYSTNGGAQLLRYRRESGKGLDVWLEGLELAAAEARTVIKQQKGDDGFKAMYELHQRWVQHRGTPATQADWKGWFDYLKQNGHDYANISKFYQRLQGQAAQAQGGK